MNWILGLLILGGICWSLFRTKKKEVPPTPRAIEAKLPVYEDYQDALERKPIDELDEEERIIRRAHDAFQSAQEHRAAEYRSNQDALADDQKKIKRATDFIKTSYLDCALPYIHEETQHWPSWVKRESGPWTPPLPLSDVDGTTSNSYQKSEVEFRAGGSPLYRIEFERSKIPADDDWEYGSMTLFVDREAVLGMFVKRDWTKEYARWEFDLVESLKVGPWIEGFIAFYTQLRSIEERKSEDWSNDWVRAKAAKIDLGTVE